MASYFEMELDKLKKAMTKISTLAENQVVEAMKVLLLESDTEGKVIKKNEEKIDKLDVKIDEICQALVALQQPVATDLRFILSAMQISNEFERIGDLSLSIIKKTKSVKEKHDLIVKHNIEDLSKDVEQIALKSKYCLENIDGQTVEDIFELNKVIQIKSEKAIQDIIAEMKDNSKVVVSGTYLIMILKCIERISEHSTNVAESVYFTINAKIIKH